ncbi:MAG: hypothetical protein AAGF12_14035 [Myxococcota bacterium]
MSSGCRRPSDQSAPPTPKRFELDTESERAVGRLRLGAALVVAIGSVWILAAGAGTIGTTLAIVGLLASVGWVFAFRGSRKKATKAATYYLELDSSGLTLAEGKAPTQVKWSEITSVDVDEDRLVVAVARRNDKDLILQPRYRGVDLYSLAAAVETARSAATARLPRAVPKSKG